MISQTADERMNKIDWETVDCQICGGADFEVVGSGEDYVYASCPDRFTAVRCQACGHMYQRPRPSRKSASIIYPPHYSTRSKRFSADSSAIGKIKNIVYAQRNKFLAQELAGGGRVLDVGCGDGQLLLDIKMKYPEAELTGIDLEMPPDAMETMAANGISVMIGALEETDLPTDHFDVIMMNQLIEHLWEPRKALEKAFRALRPGGLLSVETVNTMGYDWKWFNGGAWGGYYFPRHMNFFSSDSLAQFLESVGFVVERKINLCATLIWIYSLRALTHNKRGWKKLLHPLFNDLNPAALFAFAFIETAAKSLGFTTSNQKILARKPI